MSNLELCQIIRDRIFSSPQHRITFAEYMDLVLYHRDHGYYTTGKVNIGSQGDFFTSPHLGADFGELLAIKFLQLWESMGKPSRFDLVEMGAGHGILAQDILNFLQSDYPDFFSCLQYTIIEKSSGLISRQQQTLSAFLSQKNLFWKTWHDLDDHSIIGCFFSNELLDAFPVHQFILDQGEIKEVYVTVKDENSLEFIEVIDQVSTTEIKNYFDLVGIKFNHLYKDGYRSEVNLSALDWLKLVSSKLKQGYVLTIDYGYDSVRYYNPQRYEGTLKCYYQHRHHNNPYIYIGEQDLTAHVDFKALQIVGEKHGLTTKEYTKQGLFLMELGIGDRLAKIANNQNSNPQDIMKILKYRDGLHQLINPTGLGGFAVLIQEKLCE
jgi:SAM-dependent MidA family methyltransferase